MKKQAEEEAKKLKIINPLNKQLRLLDPVIDINSYLRVL